MALGAKVVLTAEDRTANAFRSVQRNTNKLEGSFDSLKGVIGGLVQLGWDYWPNNSLIWPINQID